MIAKAFRSNQPLVLAFLPLLMGVLWLPGFIDPSEGVVLQDTSLLFTAFDHLFPFQWLNKLVAMTLIFMSAMVLNMVINREDIFERPTFLPALIYVLLMSAFRDYQQLHPLILANFFLILALRRLFQIRRAEDARAQFFDAGLFIGMATLFYPHYIFLYLLAVITVLVLRPFVLKEYIVGLLGLILPILLLLFYHFMVDAVESFPELYQNQTKYTRSMLVVPYWKRAVALCLAGLLAVLAARSFLKKQRSSSLRFKRLSNIILFYGLLLVGVSGLQFLLGIEPPLVFMSTTFFSFFFSFYFFYTSKPGLSELIVYLCLAFLVVNIYGDFVYKLMG